MIYILPTDTCFWIACEFSDIQSYNNIYKIKKLDISKPLPIMVEDFDWLEENTDLNLEQIDFLKNYKNPFTIVCDAPRIKMILNLDQADFVYENKKSYKKIAFRVANLEEQKKLISEVWPIFLTSASYENQDWIQDLNEVLKQFSKFEKHLKIISKKEKIISNYKKSEIIEFIWDTTKINILK